MSNILRAAPSRSRVFIGERHLDFDQQKSAVAKLGQMLPLVNIITDMDGAKFIPVQEISKIENHLGEECARSFEEGRKSGFTAGKSEGLQEARKVLGQLNSAIQDAVAQREALLNEARQKVLELVIQIARKVTYDALELNPESILAMINGVIDSLVDRSRLKIKVNPDHLPIVEQNVAKFLVGSTTIKEIAIEPDPRVKFGGCFIETPTGDIDARLESQFAVIEDALRTDGE